MNGSIIRYIIGSILRVEGILLLLPCGVSVIYKEQEGLSFLIVAVLCFLLGMLLTSKKPRSYVFYFKEGCVTTALCWITISIFGALPFMLTGEIPSFTNALFETVSGFTTTGSSILSDIESLSRCSLFWRSFTNWIGGMGVLVFLLAIVPLSGDSNMNLMRAESPGPAVGKLVPKVKHTARILYLIYIGLTIIQMILLVLGKMPIYDAVCASFSTAGTGGFGIKNDSMASYSLYCQWVITIFMLLFGVNFNAYYLILFGQFKSALKMEEVRCYFIIVFASIALIFINMANTMTSVFQNLSDTAFQVASIITTTGFATVDFDTWPEICRFILLLLMFIGACAGSTGGGIKVSRLIILFKTIFKEIHSYIHPKSIKKIKMDGKPIEHEFVRATNVYFITFIVLFILSVFLISFEGHDFTTNFSAVAATINNIGPGLNLVGPTCNFEFMSGFSKYVLIFDMLAGRLELFPLLLLFTPVAWKGTLKKNRK